MASTQRVVRPPSRARRRLPNRSGTAPATVTLAILGVLALVFSFSPSLNPLDLLTGHFLEVPVPQLRGLTQDRALVELERNRLHGDVDFVFSSDVPRGKVVRQRPTAGSTLDRDGIAKLWVSRGAEYLTLPKLEGTKRSDALRTLRELGLEVDEERRNDEDVPVGVLISQKPAAGTVVEGGSTVSIQVSTGPATRTVPEVTGLPIEGAAFMLGKAGFQLGTLTLADNPVVGKGGVVGTDPPAKTVLPRDAPVNLVVSAGPPPVVVPKVTGSKQAEASSELAKLGLVIAEVTQTSAVADPLDGVVMAQKPIAGVKLRPGEIVTITVRRAAVPPPTLPPTTLPPPTTVPPETIVPPGPGG